LATTVSATFGAAASVFVSIWQFLKDSGNLAIITTIIGGAWALFIFIANKREKASTTSVTADRSEVAAGRDTRSPTNNANVPDDSKG